MCLATLTGSTRAQDGASGRLQAHKGKASKQPFSDFSFAHRAGLPIGAALPLRHLARDAPSASQPHRLTDLPGGTDRVHM